MVADSSTKSNHEVDLRDSPVSAEPNHTNTRNFQPAKKQFYIFGYNIAHSLSPTLHNAGFEAAGLSHHYQIHETEQVDQTVEEIINRPDFGGASVTFPHKLQIGKLLDTLSPRGEKIGAINTVVVRESNGQRTLHGDNTDWVGIKRCIEKSGISDLHSSTAVVLGAGGAARAACYAIQTLGIPELIIVNRTLSKAEELASQFCDMRTRAFATLQEAAKLENAPIRLIVGCVPADDQGEDRIPSALFLGTGEGVLVEMAYKPQVTGMMTVAGRYPGWKVYRGVDVLEEQAYAQFELWTERPAPVEVMRAAMQAKIKPSI